MSRDIEIDELRAALHRVADLIADYQATVGDYPVLPRVRPGDDKRSLSAAAPEESESLEAILDDYKTLIEPNVTHWNHPGFLAYFAITGSGPGIMGEALAASLNVNAMLWRTSPAATELEETVCDWLRQLIGLPGAFRGHINDTASISTLLALAAARHALGELEIRERGLAGRPEVPRLVVYASDQAHSSVDKAVLTLGLGLENLRRLPSDDRFRLRPEALAAAVEEDRAAGLRPLAVVATAGTTSTTSFDPLAEIAAIAEESDLWLHVDAAYGGSAAICPEHRELVVGWERADSIVVNPHKWLFTPVDCSVMFMRDVEQLRSAFALVPEYLRTDEEEVTNLMDLGVQLGRRFRALKFWMVLRAFGAKRLRENIRYHCDLAAELAGWIEEEPGFELAAPAPLSVVCFRWRGGGSPAELDRFNEALLREVNATGAFLLSHTVLGGRYVLRVAIGNLKTTREHIHALWELVRATASRLS